jgi:hypothetical protein
MTTDLLFHTAIAAHCALEVYKADGGGGGDVDSETEDELDEAPYRQPLLTRLDDFAKAASVRRYWSSEHATVSRLVDGDTHMLLLRTPSTLYVAVRGSHSRADWITNISGAIRPTARTRHGAKVHGPWAARAVSAARALAPLLQPPSPPSTTARPAIVFTGHSLGGALACLIADELLGMRALTTTPLIITFGAPPFGGGSVQRMSTLNDVVRITQHGDVAPLQGVTPSLSRHLGHLYTIDGTRFSRHSADEAHALFGSMGVVTRGTIATSLGVKPHSIRLYAQDVLAICAAGLSHWKTTERTMVVELPRLRAAL